MSEAEREDRRGWVTVIDVANAIGVRLTNDQAWRVGAWAREQWRMDHGGSLPIKSLRSKTAGTGSHCFAIYPPSYAPRIEGQIRDLKAALDSQISLI